jgi:hypothetical protein
MKAKLFTTIIILLLGLQSLLAQVKQGKIIYKINYPSVDIPADQKAMLPAESTC